MPSFSYSADFADTDQMYMWDGAQYYPTVSTFKTFLGTLYQPLDADLTTYAGITPSANVQSLLSAADYAAIQTLLSLDAAAYLGATNGTIGDVLCGLMTGRARQHYRLTLLVRKSPTQGGITRQTR